MLYGARGVLHGSQCSERSLDQTSAGSGTRGGRARFEARARAGQAGPARRRTLPHCVIEVLPPEVQRGASMPSSGSARRLIRVGRTHRDGLELAR